MLAPYDSTYANDNCKILRATAFHEAGHAVVGYRFGKWVRDGGITVQLDRLGNGRCAMRSEFLLPASVLTSTDMKRSQEKRLRSEIFELLAGYLAEGRAMGGKRSLVGGNDWARCVDMVTQVHGRDRAWAEQIVQFYVAPAKRLLGIPAVWAAVEIVANRLIDRRTLSGEEAQQLLEGTTLRQVRFSYWK